MLVVVAPQLDGTNLGVSRGKPVREVCGAVGAAVDDQDDLELRDNRCGGRLAERRKDGLHQGLQGLLGAVAGDHDTDAHATRIPHFVRTA